MPRFENGNLNGFDTNFLTYTNGTWYEADWGFSGDIDINWSTTTNGVLFRSHTFTDVYSEGTISATPIFRQPYSSIRITGLVPTWRITADNNFVVGNGMSPNSGENARSMFERIRVTGSNTVPFLFLNFLQPSLAGGPSGDIHIETSGNDPFVGGPDAPFFFESIFDLEMTYNFSGKLTAANLPEVSPSIPVSPDRLTNGVVWRLNPYRAQFRYLVPAWEIPIDFIYFGGSAAHAEPAVGYWPIRSYVRAGRPVVQSISATATEALTTNIEAEVELYIGTYGMVTNNDAPSRLD